MSKLYAFSIIFIAIVGFAAYFLGKYIPATSDKTVSAIDNYQTAAKIIEEYGGVAKVYPDSLANYPNNSTYSSYNSPKTNMQIEGQESVQVYSDPNIDLNNQPKTVEDVKEAVPLADIPVVTNLGEEYELYKSRLNKRVTFLIPKDSNIDETGIATNIKFIVTAPSARKFTMLFSKVDSGCFDTLGSFSIKKGQGIDFRIIQENKEITLENNLAGQMDLEMYGSYAGLIGFRGNACLRTAIPTKIEIRSGSYGRYEGGEAYKLFDKIINSITA